MSPHLISRVTVLGTGLIGGSFALALRKHTEGMRISGWDRPEIAQEARARGAVHESFTGDLAPALRNADLIYIALPIAATLDLLPEIARHAPLHALVTDACSTKLRITFPQYHLCPGPRIFRFRCSGGSSDPCFFPREGTHLLPRPPYRRLSQNP